MSRYTLLGRIVTSVAVALTSFLLMSPASAATRTVCYHAQVLDERVSCPEASEPGGGVTRPCEPDAYTYFVGGIIELWDKDEGPPDDFIGSWVIGGSGQRCVTFEWELASYAVDGSILEAHPDVYARFLPRVRNTSGAGTVVRATNTSGTEAPPITFRDIVEISNCTGTCSFPNLLWNTTTGSSTTGQQYMILDSAQRTLQLYSTIMDNVNVDARYGSAVCSTDADASSVSRTEICFASLSGYAGDRPNHELGHNLQKMMFEQDSLNDVYVGGSWTLTSQETESAATQEGWASYVAGVSWYNPQTTTVIPRYRGYGLETASPEVSNCLVNAQNRLIPGQGAKAFWDYDDANNEPGVTGMSADDDLSSKTTLWMAQKWDDFPDGTGNHQDREPGNNGVNVVDYRVNAELTSASNETLIRHNCLDWMDP